jgi:hypothetical protein
MAMAQLDKLKVDSTAALRVKLKGMTDQGHTGSVLNYRNVNVAVMATKTGSTVKRPKERRREPALTSPLGRA